MCSYIKVKSNKFLSYIMSITIPLAEEESGSREGKEKDNKMKDDDL